jgi:hypothetical protein
MNMMTGAGEMVHSYKSIVGMLTAAVRVSASTQMRE